MGRARKYALAAFVAAVTMTASGATRILLGDSSAAASSVTTYRDAKYAVNGAGLNGSQHTNTADYVMWMSALQASTVSGQWFRVDLGQVLPLDHFKLWNCNYGGSSSQTNRGVRDSEIYLSSLDVTPGTDFSDTSQWTRVINKITVAEAPGVNSYTGEPDVSLLGLQGRWLALRVLSNYSTTDFRVGISELQVFQVVLPITASIPAHVYAAETSPTAASVMWTAPTNVSVVAGYRVYRDGALLGTSVTTNFSDPGPLDMYRSYEYAVSAYDAAGYSSTRSASTVFAYRRFPFTMPWDDADTNSVADMSGLSAGAADTWVTATNGHLQAGVAQIRFLGVNMVFGAAFPDHAAAGTLAARLAKLGVNCVRFHHMDNGVTPRGIFTNVPSSNPMYLRTLDPGQMDKLDYFIARLKEHGIYADLNLHVSRSYPGYPTNGVPNYFKGIDNFVPGLVALQQEYASNLLTHVNAYTGKAYVNEPSVALIEINNENGLIHEWQNGTLGPSLHTNYISELTGQWNAWLAARYTNTAALSAAWAPASALSYGRELLTNGNFAAAFALPWEFRATAPAAATAQIVNGAAPDGGNALRISVTATNSGSGTVQFDQGGLALSAGQPYAVSFWVKADAPRAADIGLRQNYSPWSSLGATSVPLTADWQKFTLVISPGASETNARLDVASLGAQTGTVWFAGLSVMTGNTLLGPSSACAEGTASPEMLTNGNFAAGFVSPWSFQVIAPAAASKQILTNAAPDGGSALEVNVTTNDAVSWYVQYYQTNLHVTNGQPYTVTFWAKTELPRSLEVNLMQQNNPYSGLASATVTLSTNWLFQTVALTPTATENAARITLGGLATQTGKVWFASISLRAGTPGFGLISGETLGHANILADKTAYALRTRAVQRDWMRFLWDTESGYWAGMRDYVRNTLGAKSLLVGTQTSYSPSLMQAELDVVDSHAYWQHPSFPGTPWDSNNYTIKNLPMTSDTAGGTIPGRAQTRVPSKPFICTEFNHPAPSTFTAEALPLDAAYAALQQWDAIFFFQYLDNTNWSQAYFNGFFSTAHEPAKLITYPLAAAILRSGVIAAAANEARTTVPLDLALSRIAQTDVSLGPTDFGVDSRLALHQRLAVCTGAVAAVCSPWRDTNATAIVSDTGELTWDTAQKVITLRAPLAKAIIGDANGQAFDLGHGVVVTPGATLQRSGWCALTLLVRDGPGFQSPGSRILLTATGYTDNHRQIWSPGMGPTNATSMVASTNWGSAPTLLEGISATVVLARPASAVSVWALDESGRRKASVPVTAAGGQAAFTISRDYQTAWYEVDTLTSQATPFGLWQASHFTAAELADPAVSGLDADPDGDGLNNLFEYAIGTDPRGPGVDGRYVAGLAPDNGMGYLTVTALKNPAATDVQFSAEVSADLVRWTNDVTILLNDLTTFSARDNTPVSAAPRRFLRTKVTRQ